MRFYIACGHPQVDHAKQIAAILTRNGHEQTFDWTEYGDLCHEDSTRMEEVSYLELRAVTDAELVIVLLPGGNSTHTELGVALASRSNKRILVWSEDGSCFEDANKLCPFYYLPVVERITGSFERLCERLGAI